MPEERIQQPVPVTIPRMPVAVNAEDLMALLDDVGIGVCITDTDFANGGPFIRHVNQTFERCTGYKLEEIEGLSPRILEGGHVDESIFRAFREKMERDEIWSSDTINHRRDGSPFWLSWSARRMADANGTRYLIALTREGMPNTGRDSDGEQTRTKLSLALDLAKTGYWEIDYEGDKMRWSPKVYELLGVPRTADLTRAYVNSLIHPEDRETARKAFRSGRSQHRYRIIRPLDGKTVYIQSRMVPRFDESGRHHYLFGTHQDVTDEVRAREILSAKEAEIALWLKAVETAGEGLAIVDPDGGLRFANPAFSAMFAEDGEQPVDLIGKDVAALLSGDENASIRTIRERIAAEGTWQHEVRRNGDDGAKRVYEVALTQMEDSSILCVARDVSERHRMTAEADLLRSQFYQAQKMEAIGRLAGGIAHDFNNILSSILGYTALLLDDLDKGSEQHEFARQIDIGSKRATHLVKQILAYSRRGNDAKEPLSVVELFDEVGGMLRTAVSKSVDITIMPAPPEAKIMGDRTQLIQVLMNLAVNARDALPEGRGTMTLEADFARLPADMPLSDNSGNQAPSIKVSYDGTAQLMIGPTLSGSNAAALPREEFMRIRLSDSGTGIEPATLSKIFDPFFTTKGVGKGTGLGLSAVQGIIGGHGGGVELVTKIGVGTSVALYLPLLEAPAHTVSGAGHEAARRPQVILVNTEEQRIAALADALEAEGIRTILADTPMEARRIVEDAASHLRVAVIAEPGTGSCASETLGELRRSHPYLRAIFLSAPPRTSSEPAISPPSLQTGVIRLPRDLPVDAMVHAIQPLVGSTEQKTSNVARVSP